MASIANPAPRLRRTQARLAIVMMLDLSATAASFVGALVLRIGPERALAAPELIYTVPLFAIFGGFVFWAMRLHQRVWRYSSVTDLLAVIKASALAVGGFALLLAAWGAFTAWLPRSIPAIQLLVLISLLGTMRIARRLLGEYMSGLVRPPAATVVPARLNRPALVVGRGDQVEELLRRLEHQPAAGFRPVGILDERGFHHRLRVRGVPVLGAFGDIADAVERLEAEGNRPHCLLFASDAKGFRGAAMANLVADAQRLNLEVAYPAGFAEFGSENGKELDFRYLDIADLLGRPQAELETQVVAAALSGRCVLVTGAGGTIGRELARQIASFNPARLLLLDANEFNLYEADLDLRDNHPKVPIVPVLCSIRQRRQLMNVFAEHRPQLVFHAAALKHVPLVEAHIAAAVQTNVLGTRNVADAARRFGARAMVQVSTDKAVNPVGFMGVSKRLGELYCQALDLEAGRKAEDARFMTVRFGNVLGSSGSLIPLFQRQLSRGGPLTVTHPEIERYFMTVHEAVQLILHSAAVALRDGSRRGRIFVLDMGEPVRIIDVARRMIRLAGLEPDVDVPIKIVGLRPGEKLFEELFDSAETRLPSSMPGVFEAEPRAVPLDVLEQAFEALQLASASGNADWCRKIASDVIAERACGLYASVRAEPAPGAKLRPQLQ